MNNPKRSVKCVLLNNGNEYGAVRIDYFVRVRLKNEIQ